MSNNKILLVDDELNIRETITELLVYKNYEVKTAANGQDALDILDYWTPDLIICDIMMPVMNGNELHQIVKENHSLSPIPFIFLTAKNESNIMRSCLLDGADDFLSKPFKINELILVIKAKLERFEKVKNAYNNLYCGQKTSFLHEINTPLNGILGMTELLLSQEDNFEVDEIQEVYESIKISGERLNRTLQNIILYQNLINNSLEFKDTSKSEILNNLSKVKTKIFQIYEKQEKRIRFKVDEAMLKISKKYLSFILFELIDNALKFSPKGKCISVSGERYNDEFYQIVIMDFGIGFSEDELKKIGAAQQFRRDTREQQGLGLGLFLSKAIIKEAKGVFSIVSNINEGTSIKIFLPYSTS
jgi:two-component system sensor histidine kinase/response regulator